MKRCALVLSDQTICDRLLHHEGDHGLTTAQEFWRIYYVADKDFPPSQAACDFAEAYLHYRSTSSAPSPAQGTPEPPTTEVELLRMVLDLVATDELFVQPAEGGGWVFWVNVNDMFYPASDGEGIDLSEVPVVWKAWKENGWPGVVRWVQEKRGGLKLRKSREEAILNIEGLQAQLKAAEEKLAALSGPQNGQGAESVVGKIVRVDHPRFTGYGLAHYDSIEHKRFISVLLENGNTWNYEVETVRPAVPEEMDQVPRAILERAAPLTGDAPHKEKP